MEEASRVNFFQLFRVWELTGLGILGGGILAGVGALPAGIGFLGGVSLFILKSYFLYETGRTLIKNRDRGRAGFIAGFAGIGRLIFIGVTLAIIAQFSTIALIAAGGGLILCQLYFHFSYLIKKGGKQCPEE